jgi:hypothetical protein
MTDISCAFCRVVRAKPPQGFNWPATTIINGQAVCDDHAYYVQGGEHGRILAIISLDEEKKHSACTEPLVTGVKARSISERVRRGRRG